MLYEKLKNLLSEWDLYTSKEAEIPERIDRYELLRLFSVSGRIVKSSATPN